MDVHHVLQHHVVVVDLDALGDAGDGEELLVLVELYAGHDGAVVEHVRGVGQGRQRPHAVVPGNNSSLLIFTDSNLSNANRVPFKIYAVQCGVKMEEIKSGILRLV